MKTFPRVRELMQEEVRLANGSVNKVAIKYDLTHNTIGKYLEGRGEPLSDTLDKISKISGKPVAWLRGDSDDPTAPPYANAADTVDLSALDALQREAWDLIMKPATPEQRKRTVALLKVALSDD